jgi:FMN-dependent NADH-azoreductase
MPTLLHIDSSIWPAEGSASKDVAATFRKEWEAQHPNGTVIHRDLTAEPVPHIDAESYTGAADHPVRGALIAELEQADAILISAPMYNFTIPSTAGTPTVVVASRGGGYGPGTPREDYEFVITYLEKALGALGLDVHFVVPELTLARVVPAMADLVDIADASKAKAHEEAAAKAKTFAAKVA